MREKARRWQQVRAGMAAAAPEVKAKLRAQAAIGLKVRKKTFLNVIRTRLFAAKKDQLPWLMAFVDTRRVPWLALHETGGVITGRQIIPTGLLPGKRIGRKAFAQMLRQLGSYLFIVRKGGQTLVFAENPARKERSVRGLELFKRGHRARTGRKSVRAGEDIFIGVIVNRVELRARLKFQPTARAQASLVARKIQEQIAR